MKKIISVLFLSAGLLPARLGAQAAPPAALPEPLTFKGILAEVRTANPELQLARRRLGLLEAETAAATAFPNPSLEAEQGGAGEEKTSEVKLSQPVPLSRRIKAARQSAAAELDAAREELAALENVTLGAARRAYYTYRVAGERVRFEETNLQFSMDLLNKIEMRAQTGDVGNADLARAKVEAARARFRLQDSEAGLKTGVSELNGFMGRAPDAPLRLNGAEKFGLTPVPARQPSLEACLALALTRRPDLKAAALRRQGADWALKLEKGRRAPDLTVGLARGKDAGTAYTTFSLGLELPLWYNNEGGVKKARTGAALQELEEKSLVLSVKQEVYAVRLALELAGQRLLSARETVLLLNDLRKNASLAYLSGKTDLTGFYETNRLYLEENLSYLDALLDYYVKDAAFETALNGSARDEEEK